MDPLVLTLELDDASTARFARERERYFPQGRTDVGAHLTLFHAVPGPLLDDVRADVEGVTRRSAFTLEVRGLRRLSGGAAYDLESDDLTRLHRTLQDRWREHLTRQDQQPLKPHVTVQNKAEKQVAERTLEHLREGFVPFQARAEAVAVWRYVGGPWEPVQRFAFADDGR